MISVSKDIDIQWKTNAKTHPTKKEVWYAVIKPNTNSNEGFSGSSQEGLWWMGEDDSRQRV